MSLLAWVLGCQPMHGPSESDRLGTPAVVGTWRVHEGELKIDEGGLTLRSADAVVGPRGPVVGLLAPEPVGAPAVSGNGSRFVFAERPESSPSTQLVAAEHTGEAWVLRVLHDRGSPDRPAIDPTGRQVVFVSGQTGLASMWLVPFDGGPARQLTNQGLEEVRHATGEPPPGFVPPPHRGPPRFDGERLVWEAPDGRHTMRWR